MKYSIETTFETVAHVGTLAHSVVLDKDGNAVSNATTFIPGAIVSYENDETVAITGKESKLHESNEKTAAQLEKEAAELLAKAKKASGK